MSPDFKVVVAGAGPAGISFAIELLHLGLDRSQLLVLEKGPGLVDAIKKFYPEKKMTIANYKNLPTETQGHLEKFPDLTKPQTIEYFDKLVHDHKVPIRFNSEVGKVISQEGIFQIQVGHEWLRAKAAGIGIGILGRPNKPEYKIPTPLKSRILFDITSIPLKNEKVLVVGGGDSASEYCQALVLDGNQVTLSYRGRDFHRMLDQNKEALEKLESSKSIRIWRESMISELAEDLDKPKVVMASGSLAPTETFDRVIYAIGGTTPTNFLKTIGISFQNEWPMVGGSGETNIPGIYLIGDLAVGKLGGSIVTAYNSSFRSAGHLWKLGIL